MCVVNEINVQRRIELVKDINCGIVNLGNSEDVEQFKSSLDVKWFTVFVRILPSMVCVVC